MSDHLPEIDGLRAIAVTSVLLFHAGVAAVGGGFVGVDVFFVISGFLITRILLTGLDSGRLTLARFYQRRILRIAPALFAMLVVVAPLFFVLTPPVQSGDLTGSLIAAVLSYSNAWFLATTDYFADNARNPVLHTWSLAIEEQFYLVVPLLLLLLARRRGAAFRLALFAAMASVSLVAAGLVAPQDQSAAFYLPWLRAWELLFGSMLATLPLSRLPRVLRGWLTVIGIVGIAWACIAYRAQMVFPGFSALLPVIASAAVIAGVGGPGPGNALLSIAPMQWIGRISYSLYLVHWPIVCVASLLASLYSSKIQAMVVIASVVAAWVSWRFVETPFRELSARTRPGRVIAAFVLACVLMLGWILGARLLGNAVWTHNPRALRYTEFLASDEAERQFSTGTCFLSRRFDSVDFFNFGECLAEDPAKDSVLVMGDSHAANLVAELGRLRPDLSVLQATASGCRPILDGAGPLRCTQLFDRVFRKWLTQDAKRVKYVLLAGRWFDNETAPLKETVRYLQGLGKQVVVYGPSPEWYVSVPLLLAYEEMSGLKLRDRLVKRDRFTLDRRFRDEFAGIARYESAIEALCPRGVCALETDDGIPLLFDREHFTRAGVSRLMPHAVLDR